jgi:hydrogenase-4 component B
MIAAMGVLAVGCVALGLAPGVVVSVLDPLAGSLLGENVSGQVAMRGPMLIVPQGASTGIAPAVLAALLVAVTLVPLLGAYFFGSKLRKRTVPTWACGLPRLSPRMQYTATGFSKPIRMIFSSIYRATHEVEISEETSLYFRPSITYELKTESVFLTRLYEPVYRAILNSARFIRRMQTGHLQSYLAYLFITLVLLLLFAR